VATERFEIVVSDRGTRTVRRNLNDLGKAGAKSAKEMGTLRTVLGQLRALLVAVASAAVIGRMLSSLATFAQAMSTVRAATGATNRAFGELRDLARELGATTRFTATEAAEGMLFLARAGFNTTQVLASARDVLLLAQAGALDLGRAADLASNILQGFNLQVSEMGRVVDIVALAANSANTNVEQMGQAMSFAAPAAVSARVSIEQATAAIEALSNAGVQSTRAGTGLRTILIDLAKAGGDLSVQDRGLIPVLETLRDRHIGLAEASDLVGKRQASNLLILLRSIDKIKEYTKQNENAAGAAKHFADIMNDNLNGALLELKSAAESVVLSLGDAGVSGSLGGAVARVTALLRIAADNADVLAKALGILTAVIAGKLLLEGLKLLSSLLLSLGARMLALAADTIPVLLTAFTAAFIAMAAVAIKQGKSIEQVFDEMKAKAVELFGQVKNLAKSFLEPTGVVRGFAQQANDLAKSIGELGGVSKLTGKQVDDFIGKTQKLRDTISARLNFQALLDPTSQAVKDLERLVSILNDNLDRLRKRKAVLAEGPKPAEVVGGGGGVSDKALKKAQQGLDSLLSRISPSAEATIKLADATKVLNKAREAGIDVLKKYGLTEAEVMKRVERDVIGVGNATTDFNEQQKLLRSALQRNIITLQEFKKNLRDLRINYLEGKTSLAAGAERTFLKLQKSVEDTAAGVEDALTSAFRSAEDAVVQFVQTGRFSIGNFLKDIEAQLLRLATRSVIANIGASLGFGQPTKGGLLNSIFGGGGGELIGKAGGFLSSLLPSAGPTALQLSGPFANGGAFTVGSSSSVASVPGIDNRLVAFRARDGERVSVTTPEGGGPNQRPISVHYTINTPDANSFRRSQGQILTDTQIALQRAQRRNA